MNADSDAEADERLHVSLVTEDDIRVVARYIIMAGPGATQPQKRKFFATLREVIQFLLHGVRDMGSFNEISALQIVPKHDKASLHAPSQDIRGCLIDFDHAKRIRPVSERRIPFQEIDTAFLPPSGNHPLSQLKEVDEATVQRAAHYTMLRMKVKDPKDLADYGFIIKRYIGAALQYHNEYGLALPEGSLHTPEVLGWNTALLTPPLVSEANPKRTPRSGTPPYASAFILNEGSIQPDRYGLGGLVQSRVVVHDAIHDMESFFWVLLYLSLTRSGPGGNRRKELSGDLDTQPERDREQVAELRHVVYCFFDGTLEVIAWNKKRLFERSELFETLVLCHVHPYFDPLKPALRQWLSLLLNAYEFEGYEYHNIHEFVIALLEKALRDLPPDESIVDVEQIVEAMKKRSDFVRRITHAGLNPRTSEVQAATPPSSPAQLRITTAFNSRTPESQKPAQAKVAPATLSPDSPTAKEARHT
ncbi:hypothetical protein BV20DRAFT_286509 [Pilatotrama ljubarskyi]|nr:hypothetical protein BV20DRAFT_286509 [Pilatotrama ljubarskyi]